MPGLFSWKPRFRVRKTSESSDRNVSSQRGGDPSHSNYDHLKQHRAVRFNETGIEQNLNGQLNTSDWKYADDAQVPLAADEEAEDTTKPDNHAVNDVKSGQINIETFDIRNNNMEKLSSPSPPQTESIATIPATIIQGTKVERPPGFHTVVYLEFNDEVKRALFPPYISSLDTVRAFFLRTFPQLTSQYLSLPHVKIYIQEPSKSQLFYELDDLRDIRDRAVLKLREKLSGYQSPQPVRFTDHPPVDYLSESEADMLDYRARMPHRLRPTSAMDARMYGTIKNARSPIPTRYDAYYDPYASDTSSQEARSGSITPIIDKEARFRMESMERQLAGLSSLVHSALITKGISETSQRDMRDLRMQILALHPDVSSESSVPESVEQSLPDSLILSGETQQQFLKLRRHIADTHNQLKQMRRIVQMNSQNCRDILRDAFERVNRHVANHFGTVPPYRIQNESAETLKSEHNAQIQNLQKSLQTFEEDVEEVRRLVLNTNRKLRMHEVETFTQSLTKIGRNAAKLKAQFPTVQRELEKGIKVNMERIVRDERYVKEESAQLDICLRRCKTLANMMVTMKKLAIVQDPSLGMSRMVSARSTLRDSTNAHENGFGEKKSVAIRELDEESEERAQPPPVPPAPINYTSGAESMAPNNELNVLDTILDELNSSVERERNNKSKSPSSVKSDFVVRSNGPPKPPQRYSTIDVRSRFTPSEVRDMQQQAMHRAPSPNHGARASTVDLDERQELLNQKQKQLHTQFVQLQQICAPSNIL